MNASGPVLRAQFGPPAPPRESLQHIPAYTVTPDQITSQLRVYPSNSIILYPFKHINKVLGRTVIRSSFPLWWIKDKCGIAGTVFTWFLIVGGEIMFTVFVLLQWDDAWVGIINAAFSYICAFLGFIAHARTVFSDPVSFECLFHQYFSWLLLVNVNEANVVS